MDTRNDDGALRRQVELSSGPDAAAASRSFVRHALQQWHVPDPAAIDIVLCASELVAMSVAHSAGRPHLALASGPGEVTVAVTTTGPSFEASPSPTDRFGLTIVAGVVDDWGEHTDEPGRTGIWCKIRFP